MGNEKVKIHILVFGHVDSGKSTTIGEKLEKGAAEMNESSFDFTRVLDNLNAVRERGVTIGNAVWELESDKYHFSFIDAYGHPNFMKDMMTGDSGADSALLFVDSTSTGDLDEQNRVDVLLAHTLGVEQMICCFNKMDTSIPNYSKEWYDKVVESTSPYLKKLGYDPAKIPFVPISGLEGDNLIERSPNLPWYEGPTLLEALYQIQVPKIPSDDKPLHLPLTKDAYKKHAGSIISKQKFTFCPIGFITAKIDDKRVKVDLAGDIKDLERGYVASNSKNDPPKQATSFTSHIVITNNHGGQISKGYTPIIDFGSHRGAVEIEEFHSKIDPTTGKKVEKNPKFLINGDAAIVKMVPEKPMAVETFAKYPPMGRFIIRDKEQIVGVGVVKSVMKKEDPIKSAFMERGKQFRIAMAGGGMKFGAAMVSGGKKSGTALVSGGKKFGAIMVNGCKKFGTPCLNASVVGVVQVGVALST